jgi:RPA family protein
VSGREVAWRVFASEFGASLEEEKGTGERAASYVLSPLGARMNRVLVAGTLGPADRLGREESGPFFRARLQDPTGTLTVTAGGFQPRALEALQSLQAPAAPRPGLVVGKAHLFRGRDGAAYPSVRAEAVRFVSEAELRTLFGETLRQTLDRIDLVERMAGSPQLPESSLVESGVPAVWVHGAREARRRYPNPSFAGFRAPLRAVLDTVAGRASAASVAPPPPPSPAGAEPKPAAAPTVRVTRVAPPAPPAPRTGQDRAHEAIFLDLVDELAESSDDGYADLKEALRLAAGRGLGADRIEELLNRLEEDGVLEEPIVGKLRRA